jgi:hypothetical protein
MAQQEALGRLINVHYPSDNVYLSLVDAAGVTFVGYEATTASTLTLTFSSDAAGSATSTPAVIDHYYGSTAATSGGVWHKTTQAASNVVTKSASGEDVVVIEVIASMCPDGKPYVKCDINGSGIVFAVLHDLAYQRTPANLRSITA